MATMMAGDIEIGTGMSLDGGQALEAVSRAEIDIQIATARRFPRNVTAFKRQALELATLDEDTAASMYYRLPRDGKQIEGPSVRLAEVVAYSWGNLRVEARIASIDETFITAVGTAFDLERNVASRHEVKRRITNKSGRRYNDDMIATAGNAACSIALREAVFKVVPRALFKDIFDAAKDTSLGKAETMGVRRERAIGWFEKAGITRDRVLDYLGRRGVDDVTVDDLLTLTGLRSAVKDGEADLDDVFSGAEERGGKRGPLNTEVAERLRKAAEAQRGGAPEPAAHSELDAAGLSGDSNQSVARAPVAALDKLRALINDTVPKGTGALADDAQRNRLSDLATAVLGAGDQVLAERIGNLAIDAQLGKAQAAKVLLFGEQVREPTPQGDSGGLFGSEVE